MLNDRSPGARMTSLTKELHRREYRTAMQWEDKYQTNWQTLNPFQSPERLSPRLTRIAQENGGSVSPRAPGPSKYSNSPALPVLAKKGETCSPRPPNSTQHLSQRLAQLRQQNASPASSPSPQRGTTLSASPNLSASQGSVGSSAPGSPSAARTDRRTFHHLKDSESRDAFYARYIAKPKYNSIPSL